MVRVTTLALPAPPASRVDRSGEPLIRAAGVWKIFGRHADRIIGTSDAELPRAELRAKIGERKRWYELPEEV